MADNFYLKLQKLANANTAKTFKFNASESKISRQWQKQMSNTAHQREVKDLQAAGLNPVLSSGGSGAQSYTTSAASATADSAVNALASYESSKTSAAATRYAAAQNAAAVRAAAAAQAAAARYAADMNYATTKYATDNSKSGTLPGIMENFVKKLGVDTAIAKNIKQIAKNFSSRDLFTDPNTAKKNGFVLSNVGKKFATYSLKRLGVNPSYYNQVLFIKASIYGDVWSRNKMREIINNRRYMSYRYR